MMTKFSKWMLYISSYRIAYLFQIVSIFYAELKEIEKERYPGICSRLLHIMYTQKWLFTILIILILVSCIWINCMKSWNPNTRIKYFIVNDRTMEGGFLLIPLAATTLSIRLDTFGFTLTFAIFIAMGVVIVLSNYFHALPLFFLHGYHVYEDNNGVKIITKMSKDKYRLNLEYYPDGLEARQLFEKCYFIK